MVRDVRTLTDLKVRALCAVTAVTAQTDTALLATHPIPESVVRAQIAAAFATAAVQAVKVGMLATGATVRAVAECLVAHAHVPLVLDPVLVVELRRCAPGSGRPRATRRRTAAARRGGHPKLTGSGPAARVPQARDEVTALEQAQELLRRGARAVLLKGGHANGPHSVDLLLAHGASPERLSAARVGANLRGSGCALASAIAAYLAQGVPLPAACARAKNYVTALLQRS